jgi:AraC family transcriptional regulator of adaptative response/methylated-DNA-[protein]-cysteine methyltransferase
MGTMAEEKEPTVAQEGLVERPSEIDDARWQVVSLRRHTGSAFVYGVVTTGVYCRPGCASRLPRRENVRFFDTSEEALEAGFRPCKRCRPDVPKGRPAQVRAIVEACKAIDESDKPPPLASLAERAGLSLFYFSRVFKKVVGVTPKQYSMEKRLARVRCRLADDVTVTEAAYAAGFDSSSRFYAETGRALGMKPTDYKNGASGLHITYQAAQCYLGWVLVAATGRGICAIEFGDAPYTLEAGLRARFPNARLSCGDSGFDALVSEVLRRIESPALSFDLPMDIQGTAFQRRVWQALMETLPGTTVTYAGIAGQIGQPRASRAVARACAANTIAVAIPCHRVTRSDGGMGGYRWGIERKRALLAREQDADTGDPVS